MTQTSAGNGNSPKREDVLPSEVLDIIWPALQVGGLSGMFGMLAGGFAGVIRSSSPVLFALVSGVQWFALGSTFWASRGGVLKARGRDKVSPRDKISASTIAGGMGGTVGGLLRGRGNVVPGAVLFALFGAAGQTLYNAADARNSKLAEVEVSSGKTDSWLNSKWSPVKVLSDSEYDYMLQEKLLRVNAEIALIDERIVALKAQEREIAAGEAFENRQAAEK